MMHRLSDYEIAALERPDLVEAQQWAIEQVKDWIYDRSHEAEAGELTDVAELALVQADAGLDRYSDDVSRLRALVVTALGCWFEQARRYAEVTGQPMRQVTSDIVPALLSEVVKGEGWPLSYDGVMVEQKGPEPGDLEDLDELGEG
ncbi:hypothetical protein [Streptomyces blastmyceticus]|uniref:Uncharacterized protein n=1 Tax=Streptomyces blastmyceticus TaxID=68180 RepID=A0ABN0Y201_9ACTN